MHAVRRTSLRLLLCAALFTLFGATVAAAAGQVRVDVRASATSVQIGVPVELTIAVTGAPRSATARVERQAGARWVRLATPKLRGAGRTRRSAWSVTPTSLGRVAYRVRVAVGGRLLATSKPCTVTATRQVPFVGPTPPPVPAAPPEAEQRPTPLSASPTPVPGPSSTEAPTSTPTPSPSPTPPPSLDRLVPATGSVLGDELVTVHGAGLAEVDAVRFGGVPGTVVRTSDTEIVVRTPTHVPGPTTVVVTRAGDAVASAANAFTFEHRTLPPRNDVTAAPGVVTLSSMDIERVDPLPTGTFRIVLPAPDARLSIGTLLHIEPNVDGAPTGLAARVIERVDAEADGGPAVIVEQVALSTVLPERNVRLSARVPNATSSASRGAGSGAASPRAGAGGGTGFRHLVNVNRGFLDCRRIAEDSAGHQTLEPLPETDGKVQVQFEVQDLQVNVSDVAQGNTQRFEASVTGKPTLRFVIQGESKAKCHLLPWVTDRFTIAIPLGGGVVLEIKPDASVTFSANARGTIEKQTEFAVGVVQDGTEPPRYLNDWKEHPATISGTAGLGVELRVGADISVKYAGAIGLSASIGPSAQLTGKVLAPDPNLCVSLSFGMYVELSAELDLLFLNWKQTLFEWSADWKGERCTGQPAGDLDDVVLDPSLVSPASTSVTLPSSQDGLPAGSFEPINYGDAYRVVGSVTLKSGTSYTVPKPIEVPEGATLTIEPGVHLKLGHCNWTIWWPAQPCVRLAGGTLLVNGTSDEPVIFTRLSDDSVDGDSDGVPPEQSMAGIASMVMGGGVARFTHADLRQGAGINPRAGVVSVVGSRFRGAPFAPDLSGMGEAIVRVSDSRFEGEARFAGARVRVERSAVPQVSASFAASEDLVIDANTFGEKIVLDSAATLTRNRFQGTTFEVRANPMSAASTFRANDTPDDSPLTVEVTGGVIDRDVAWDDGVTYIPAGDQISVADGATLRIAGAGTTYKSQFCRHWTGSSQPCLSVYGALDVSDATLTSRSDTVRGDDTSGTAADYDRTFLPPQLGGTATVRLTGARLRNLSSAWTFPSGTHVAISGSRVEDATLVIAAEDASIRSSRFVGSSPTYPLNALTVYAGGATVSGNTFEQATLRTLQPLTLDGNTFTGTSVELYASADGAASSLVGNTTPDDGPLTVAVEAGTVSGEAVWAGAASYLLTGPVTIPEGHTLRLGAGTTVKTQWCRDYRGSSVPCLSVAGTLAAEGTSDAPVTLTRRDDASVGGSTASGDRDVDSTFLPPSLTPTATLSLRHTTVRSPTQSWVIPQGVALTIERSRLESAPIALGSDDAQIVASTFVGVDPVHPYVALDISGSRATVTQNTFLASGVRTTQPLTFTANALPATGRAFTNASNVLVSASGNWWGSAAGPSVDGADRQVDGPVTVAPWCIDATCSS